MMYYIRIDYAFQFMSGPEILFSYPYLEFIQPLPVMWLRMMQWLLLLCAIGIAVGWKTRIASTLFFIGFSYFTLIDKTLFNNHLYLFMLLALLLACVDSERCYSLRNRIRKSNPAPYIESWQIYLFRFMIVIVYFYGGIVKLHSEWLNGGIVEAALNAKGIEDNQALNAFITYGGLVYDLLVGFLLLYRPTRLVGIIAVLIFNLTNHFFLFDDIGIFPFAMILSTVVFLNPTGVARFMNGIFGKQTSPKKKKGKAEQPDRVPWNARQQRITVFVGLFVLFQLIFPFRYLLFTNNPEWTGIASRFAWRMKMQTRQLQQFDMTVQDIPDGTPQEVDFRAFLSSNQQKKLINDPYNIIQLGHYIAEEAKRRGMQRPSVRAVVKISYNQRSPQLMIAPETPLEKVPLSPFAQQYWLMPLQD